MISLHVEQLSKYFGKNLVWENISFHHESGVLGIEGPNGSGKSTLLKCLSGLLSPSSGTVSWQNCGQQLEIQAVKHQIGYAAPYISLYRELSIIENLQFLSKLRKNKIKEALLRQLLERVELDHSSDKPYGNLSTGQQQRARLAAALFTNPPVLMLDEPGSNLDEQGRSLISDIVARARDEKKLVILASNNPDELALCDRIFSVKREEVVGS
jgi:ABC-type multidrug transport system ATPase subunit